MNNDDYDTFQLIKTELNKRNIFIVEEDADLYDIEASKLIVNAFSPTTLKHIILGPSYTTLVFNHPLGDPINNIPGVESTREITIRDLSHFENDHYSQYHKNISLIIEKNV